MISGSLVALITPFRNDEVDYDALRRLVRWHLEQGTDGLVPVGTTGESATLSEQEHRKVVDTVVQEADGQIPVVAGAGSNNPHEAIAYSRYATESGATAALHVAGYYVRPNQKGLFQHFEAVHDASELPIVVYNIPPRAAVDIEPKTMARIAELPRVIGVKDATGDLTRPLRERARIEGVFSFLSGEDATAVAYNASGGNGCISVTANVAPALCAELQSACATGNFARAMELQARLLPLHLSLFREPSPAGVKFAASLLKHCDYGCRLPITTLTAETRGEISAAMHGLGLI